MATNNNNTDWRAKYRAMMTDPDYAEKMASVVDDTRKVSTNLMNKSEELEGSLSLNKEREQPLDLSRVQKMQTEQAARATMPDDDSGVADLAVQAYADARKQIGDEVSKQMADDKSVAFMHPVAAGLYRSAESMKAGDVQKTFDRMLENNTVRQAIETKANKELTAALGKNPALTEEQQKDIYNKSVQRQIDAISGRVNQYLLDVNAPKSESEYVLKSAVGNSLIGKSMLQAARNISGLESAEFDYGQQALADYDANKASWYAKGGAAIGGLLLDAPMMQGIGSASSAVLGRGTSMALGKAASNTLWGKMLIGQATAAGTLGGYNFTSTLASQMMGGRFDAGELFGSTMHGVGLGAATGGMTPLLRGATAGMGAVGKTATMGGGILGEAAAFSAPEWVETFNENPYDFKSYAEALGTNVMVIAGLKASNLPKTVQEYKEWWNQGKTSGFTNADYKALSDYALAKGYANDGAFTYQDGVYQRSMADRATGGRNILTMTKLEGGKERNLAMEMYQDPNVPLSMKTKIAAKMGLPAPNPVLPNAVEARDNVVNTYYEYREQMSDGTYVTRRILVDSKEMPSKHKARAAASEFGRTKARQNSIIQSEAEANTDATNAIVMARLTEQAWRSGTNVSDEVARMYDIAQRAQRGEASAEDIAYYQSVMEGTTEVTDRIKADIKDKTGVDIDEVLKQEGTFNTAQDKALTMYGEALASLKDNSKPTTERGTTASQASIADYIELKGMGIEQTKQLLNDPTAKVAAEKEIRNKYALWLKYFDGQMTEEQLASRLGYNLDNTKGLMDFVNEEAFFRGKAANRIAYNAANAAKRLLEQGNGGVRFTEDGKVKLQGVPYSIAVDESIVDRYRAAQQGSGENYQRIANDALKDIIRQSEQPIEEMPQQMAPDEQPIANEPQNEQEVVTQQMVDNRLAEIDTDLQGIEADGVQRVNINDKPAMIVKGRIATIGDGEIDRAKSSTEVAYIPLDENGRPIKNEQGKPVVEVGVKPSNVRISEVEPWRTVEDYKRAEEQRIRDNNRLTDEAMAQVGAEDAEVKEELPTLDKVVVEPKDADELVAMCDGDKALALDVAVDELAKAQAAKGKGASTAETIGINRRIRTYQQIVDRLSASEMPDAAAADVEAEQTSEATKAEPQVTEDMEFVYQKDLGENHEGMEPMQMADGRYKWVGLQRGELTATMGERDVELLDGLAKKLGVAVIPINVADSAVNGYYRDGNVYVNTNRGADWTMRWVAGHELLHDVAKKSPEAYNAYKQAVLDMWGSDYIDDQVKQIIDDYAASGKTIDREQALTELVNDFGGELFNSRDGLNILNNILKDESRKGNTGFVNTIKQWWERLKEFFGGTPYYNEAQKMLEQAYKDAMQNVDYKVREEQLSKDMDNAFFGEPDVVKPKVVETELKETKDFTPTKMPSGTTIEDKPSGYFSVKSIMRGVGIDAQNDGDNVWFEKDGKRYSKDVPMTIAESESGILKDMVDQCVELGLMDEAKSKDVYKMYTGIVNKIIEKADGSFADLNNQYLWLGETVYRVVHSNSDKQYKRSLDVTLVCKKNEAVIRSISELQRRQGFGVTPAQIMQLYYSTLDKGFQVPCPVCYVFSRYIQNGQYTSNLIYGHHKFDKDKYFKNPAKMSAKKKAEAEQYWLEKYNEAVAWEEANKKLIADAKSVLSWATKEMDMLMFDAAKGRLDKAKRKEYKERASKLDAWYRAALDLVAQSDMSGYIKSVIANPIVKDKKVVGMQMREDAGQKMTQEVEETILDYRKVALAKTKYPHISRYIASKGSAAGKGYNFEADNPMGDILQQLSTDSKNYFQEAMDAASEKERSKLMERAKERTMKSAMYAAQQSLRGGIRQWSWSDNIEALAPDVALNAMQVGMLGGAMQTYSKQLEGIEMMAAMGAYVNGSLMGKGMGYQKVSESYSESPKWQDPSTGFWYTLAFDDVVGVQPRSLNGKLGLFALNQMYDRAGNILVGMNDIHIRTAMADPRIFFIIPWHASGMSDHILKQMNSMLKLDIAGFKASDYTKHQEEKMYKEKKETDKADGEDDSTGVSDSTIALWRSHDYSDRFINNDGTKANIAIEDGALSADQLHYRELRDAIFMHSNAESAGSKDKAFWAEHQDWLAEIKNDIFLNQAYESVTNGPGRFGIAMTTDDCGFIYPYEYWDKTSTFDNADINGQRYVEYCRRLGVKPKFSGVDSGAASNYGNFIDDAGYWKLLIDRRMYDREGKYQELTPVDPSGFKADFVDQDKTAARFPVTVVADKGQTSDIVDDVQYNELKTYKKKKLKVDYKVLPETAVKNAAEALMQYNQAKQLVSMAKTGKLSVKIQKELYELELERLANEEALADIENDNFLADEGAEMSIVRDRNKIEELEGEELVPMLRTFQILDGALYSPMATIQRGKKVHSVVEGDWWKADENADLAQVKVKGSSTEFYDKDDDRISKKDGKWVITVDGEDKPLATNGNSLSYYFNLKKGEKGDVVTDDLYAAYNPYIHASRSALNDQFKGAYLRPNLVLAEVLVPKSELDGTNRYKADYAKDGIGEVDWNSGTVIKQAVAAGHPGRKVALSRYAKIGRVFTNAEWADRIDEELAPYKDKITLPFISFPPEVLRELANKGYKVEPPTSKKAQPYYEAWLKGEEPTGPNGGGKPTEEFSIKADKELDKKSLVGIHNLTEDNLRYALNLGGLANPSTAVIDKNIMGLEGFGDISLIMPKSLVAKSTGKNAGTFAGDAYTPRFPKGDVVKYITKEGEKAIRADYPGDDKFSKDFREAWQSYGNEYGGITPALYYMYKLENGGAKIVKAEAPKIKSKEHQRMIDKFGNKEWYELNDAEKRELVNYRKSEMIESLKGADKNMVDKVVNDFINSADPEDLAYKKLRMLKMDYKEQQKAGEIDYMATYRNAQDDVALAGEQAKFNKWLADKSKRYGIEDRIFRGYTASGNRKYAPMTLANISKVMKEQGRAGAETFMAKSAYSLRGKMLPVYKTLEQIKKNKSKLADTETYEKFRKEIGDEYNELILDISELPNVKYDDTHYILEDALLKGFDYAEKQAGIQISKAVRERISAFGNLLKEAPVKYFETKFERPVMFDEFVAAVVPKNINPELRKALADKGLAIEEYERGSEESRLEAVRRASDRDDVQFSVKGKRADESVLDYAKRMSEETGKKNLLNGGSYFSGGGLLEEGLKGIVNPTIAVEFNQKVAGVYRNNFGEHIVTADVRDVDPATLVKDIDGPVAYFHASPVCKNFSKAKQSAEELPLDKATAQSTAEFISKVRPKIVTIENVKGYRDSESMKIILDELKKQGYNYDVDVYNAADYGAYTSRERLIVRAVRDWSLPAKPMVMLADDRPSGWLEAVADIIDTLPEKKGGVAKWMDERLMAMGIDYRNIDKPLYVFGSGYSKDRIGYAFADELVPTLRTKGGDVIVMPDGRVLKATPRVLARISGMSDDYTMPKSDDLAHTVVGNGIPVQLTKAVMGSLIENVKSDLDAGNTEYSIIGKRGAANLDKRDETSIRVDNMVTAEDMEKAGKDVKTIRMATGWERGADGKWRYEVKDLVMLPAEQWIGKKGKKLSDIVENADELFAAYPELAKVKIKEGNGKTYGGSYSSGVITLDTYLAKLWMKRLPDSLPRANKYMNEALIHEIQHYIQEEEGFAKGGNESVVLDKDAVSRISALIDDSNKLATQYNNMIERGVYEGREAVKDEIIALRAKANAIRNSNRLGYDGYRRLAGEAEARNAEKRLGMTEEERKNSLLADTEDVGRDEQIVYGNTDDEYSIKIRGKEYRNDGYTQRENGTNVSIRALDAEENGTHSKGNFIKAYKVAKKDFDLLASLGVIKNTEWHHTGTNFNKTDYFSWADSEKADGDVEYGELAEIGPNSMAEIYKTNKKEIGQLTDEYNNAKWGPLAKEREKLPTIEYITERYISVSNPEKYSLSDWLTKEEKNSKSAEHEEISRGGEAYGTSYERRQMHEGVDYKYDKIAYDRKKEWAESHKDDIRRKYDEIAARVEKYNAEILPLEDVFANDAKGKPLMKLLEMFGYSADDAAKKVYHLQHQYYSDTIYERMAEASEKVRKEYDAKIESARVDFDKWLSKAVKDGKAEFVERVAIKPEYFITTKEEMNGRYGWFEATSRYNLPRYYSGYKFKTKRMYDSYKKREEDIFKIELEQISKTQEASNNVYNEYLKASHAVREDLVEKPLAQGDYSIKGGNTPERRADEVARLKQRIEQLSQEKDAIAEDGAKVKDIASEMTSFIKQNISTEIQSDMTRNQFKGILNQLETAVTKKDLEKPMQMIEHIGTNVTRRSLTRQMRNFLKSEFKSMTPQGAVKAKTVDGATSRVLELAKTMYATMNKLPLGGEVAALQKQMRDLKAAAIEWANDQSADTKNLLADVLKVTERPAATRYGELAELRNKVAADGSASGEMLGYIDHMLDIMGDIDYFRGEQQKAKEASALNSKEDLEALKSELLDKSDKGILSEEDKAVLDNMPLYEMMVNLRQQQLDIDGGGAASIDAQIRNKQNAIKAYRAKMNELPKTDTAGRERYKALIEQVEGEIDDLFASRIVDQKAVNNGMRELIDDLVTLKEQGHSRLVEWSKGKQERSNGIRKLANDSFSSTARGYWDEVNKKGHRLRDINNFLNNAKLTVISPALSFEYMLGTLDKKYYTNDSPIYNRFIKSQDGLLKANDNFFEGLESYNKEVNDAANRLIGRGAITNMAEWFKLGDRFATEEIPFAFEVDQMFDDGTVRKVTKGITATMTRGQAAKIYAWSRMADGMAKLKAHGVTDETIAAVKDFIGEGYMRFVDWVEDDFFPRLRREKYNPKYKEIYGISMAENEHYFPFAIYKKDVRTNIDLEQIGDDKLGGGLVGNLIERKRNNARLDFTRKSPDIFDMITRYGETMEEWNAYAQVREDLKAMVNDKQFKVKCDMFGTDYYKHFLEAARVASRTSDDKALAGKWNTTMSKLQKVLASGAISMRVSTALKQLLSAPAFAVYSLDPKFLHQLEKTVVPIDVESAIKGLWKISSGDLAEAKKLLLSENWVGHYNWCVNNLPSFRERVSLGGAGNPILEEKGFDTFFGKLCDAVQSAGMIPNRLVDAFTCSVGAKAVYEYNFNKYKKMYGEKTAHNMAVTEAEIAFNSSQQSSNPVFLSPMQVTKQFFVRGLMNFKNSPIGYLRAGLKANTDIVRAIKSIYNPTFKVDGQEMRFNSNGKNANSMLMTAAARSAMYNFYLNFIWNFGVYGIAGLSSTAIRNLSGEGNEDGNLLYSDEEWKKATGDNWAATLFLCATQGLPYISGPFATAEQGTEYAPLMLLNTLNEMGTDIYQSGLVSPVTAQWITNLALKNGAGIDPQVCAQVYEGMQGILADRPVTEEDIMNLLASPRSAISGMTKQKVGEYDRLRDYVNARIKSNREIGIDERMDFGKALAGKRELRKSNLDYYIDEYLEANIPGYREISGRKSKETKQEEQANKKLYEQSMSLVEKIVSTPKGEADEQKSSKIDSEDYDTKYKVRKLRDAVSAIHKLYAAGDYGTAEDIAAEMQRRIERGYDPNGKTLDERLKNVDIWKPAVEVTQKSADGYSTNFDRAIGGEFKKMYVGKMNGEGN